MKIIQPSFALLRVVACLIVAFSVVCELKADDKKSGATGTWTWTTPGRNGGPERKSTLKLKVDGDKVTGSISSPGRQGQIADVDIEDGKLKGDEISFSVTRQFGDNKVTQKYTGKLEGDSIKGKITFDRNGEAQSRDWDAKRESEKK